jgi:thiamine-phosphate pyrophosphorylase
MREIYRILDANFNRAREALRVAEDCGRFALNDPAVTSMAKHMRSELQEILQQMPLQELLVSRNTPGDIGTDLTSPTEPLRKDLRDVATAACKRLSESLRSIEEYSKIVAPGQTLAIERMRYNAYTLEQRVVGRFVVVHRFAEVRLIVLLSSEICSRGLRDTARLAIVGGADCLQLREKNVPDGALLAMAAELRELTDETDRLFVVNDRPDVAAIVSADGVHLGQHDLPVTEARRLLRPDAVLGKSTHSPQQAVAAANEGADYIGCGPVFETRTKDAGQPVGTEMLQQVRQKVEIPIAAIGGITAENAASAAAAGATCVAVSSAVCCAEDPAAAAAKIRQAVVDNLNR